MDGKQLRIIMITAGIIVFLPIIIYIIIKKPVILILLLVVIAGLGYTWLEKKGIA